MRKVVDYAGRIPALMAELRTKTLTEAERDRNITRLDYTGVGYGYNLKTNYPQNTKEAAKDIQMPDAIRD